MTPGAGEADPRWPREALAALWHEIAAYLAAGWAVARRPARFASGWARGEVRALNPLACVLNALAIFGPWRALWIRLLHIEVAAPLWVDMAKPLLPAVALTVIAGGAHGLLKLLAWRRPLRPLRTSLGITLYVNAGPVAFVGIATRPLSEAALVGRVAAVAQLASVFALGVFMVYLVVALAAAHEVQRRRVAVALGLVLAAWIAFWAAVMRLAPDALRALIT